MRFWCLVLIAAVAVNSLVTTINAKSTSKTVIEPFNMLLPPLADKTEDVAVAKTSTKAAASSATDTTAAASTKKTTKAKLKMQTTLKPLTNDVNNVALPELSIESLLPPLFEPKIEKAENNNKQETAATTDDTTALGTTTTARTTTTTTARTTRAPSTTTTNKSLTLHDLEPPLEGEITNKGSTVQSGKEKPTKKSYYQQQRQNLKNLSSINDESAIQSEETKISPQETEESPAEAASNFKSNSLPQNIISDIEPLANNYRFDLYLGSTTPRPAKQGLPTITPFPNRLGR